MSALLTNVPMAMNLLRLRLQEVTLAIDKPVSSVLEREKLLTHSWNIEGLVPKALDKSFINYLSGLDFFCLLETSVDSFTFPSLCNYNEIITIRQKIRWYHCFNQERSDAFCYRGESGI